jgi:hypothetical protein
MKMGSAAILVLKVIVFSVIAIGLYNLLKIYVLSKFKPNLFVKIGATIVSVIMVLISSYLSTKYNAGSWQYYIGSAVVILVVLITVDFWIGDKRNVKNSSGKNDSFKPKPKAKPNRVKNRKN